MFSPMGFNPLPTKIQWVKTHWKALFGINNTQKYFQLH